MIVLNAISAVSACVGRRQHRQRRFARHAGRLCGKRMVIGVAGVAVALAVTGVGCGSASASEPAPAWAVQAVAMPSVLSPAEDMSCTEAASFSSQRCEQYAVVVTNVGARASSGLVTVRDTLPEGVTVASTPTAENVRGQEAFECAAEAVSAHSVVTCTSETAIPPLTPAIAAISIPIVVAPEEAGPAVSHVEVSGGGAQSSASAETQNEISGAPAAFAVEHFGVALRDEAGRPITQAAARPSALTMSFSFPSAVSVPETTETPEAFPIEDPKQIVTDLPPGVIGDALATPTCSLADVSNLNKANPNSCPPATQIGTLSLIEPAPVGISETELKIFNVVPERGYPAEFAVYLPTLGRAALLYAHLVGSGSDTHVRVITAPQDRVVRFYGLSLTFFGDPTVADDEGTSGTALLTEPSDCATTGFVSMLSFDTWQHPGRTLASGEPDLSDPNWKSVTAALPAVAGCESLQFHPTLTLAAEAGHTGADEPSGYESTLRIPQNEVADGLGTPPLKTTVVTLPPGVAISPSAANGLVGCQATGAEGIELESDLAGSCPAASKVGEVEARTPVLEEPLEGSVYVSQPTCGGGGGQPECSEAAAEAGEVFGLYLELSNERYGVHVKLKGKVELGGDGHRNDLAPGQVRATFAETPQQPVSELKLRFSGGARAPLANPQSCGTFTTTAELEPWSHIPAPGEQRGTPLVTTTSSFGISGCESGFAPQFTAGTVDPRAATYSPFTLTLSRKDREQDLSSVAVSMPAGLLGKIAGIVQCGEPQANAGTCPEASRIGTATAAAGSGREPLWQDGGVYLTGPYAGAPFGLSIVVPAKAGPYNLGNVLVRAAIHIDPSTAAITVVSNPLPQSVDGVPLRLKVINVTIDREGFTFNASNCSPLTVGGVVGSTEGATRVVSDRYQATSCDALEFEPQISASTSGRTSKAAGASLRLRIDYPKQGEANLAKTDLVIPKILPTRLTTLQKACTEAQFNANPAGCPPASVIATVVVHTTLLNSPLVGPAYFVSHGGAAFPDVEIVLQGEGVTVVVDGKTQIKGGVTYSRFDTVPDAPFTSLEFTAPEGPYSIFAANGDLCANDIAMTITLTGQNGSSTSRAVPVEVEGCPQVLTILSRKTANGTITLKVAVPEAGSLAGSGKGLSKAKAVAHGRGPVTLKLRNTKRHGLRTKVKLVFKPAKGRALTSGVSARFRH
jgi:uncharacterized repeat protein (TIGR01451 family)